MTQHPSKAECLETFVRTLLESSQMPVEELLQLASEWSGIPVQEVERAMNANPFRAEEPTLDELIGEAISRNTFTGREK